MNSHLYGRRWVYVLLLTILGVAADRVGAHTDEWFDNNPTPHGGQVRMSGPYHLELVIDPDTLRVYVTDHADNGIPTAGWTGQAIIMAGDRKTRFHLIPAGDNLMQADVGFPDTTGMKLVVKVQPRIGEEYAARFTPGQRGRSVPDDAQHSHHATP